MRQRIFREILNGESNNPMNYKIIIDDFDCDFWRSQAVSFMDYSLYQTWAYQDVRMQKDEQAISRFIIQSEEGTPCLMGQVRIRKISPLGLRIGYTQWGPLCRKGEGVVDDVAKLFNLLKTAYIPVKVNVLRITPNIFEEEDGYLVNELPASGFEKLTHVKPYQTMLFPLATDEEGIRSRFHAGWRRYLNKAQKTDMEIRQGVAPEYMNTLKELYRRMCQKKRFEGLGVDTFEKTQQYLATPERMNMVLSYLKGQVLTAHMTSHLGDTALGILAGSSEEALQLNSTYLVWWHTLLAAKNAGMKRYDLGGINPNKNPKVYQFKRRMGAIEAHHVGVFEAYSSAQVKCVWRIAEKLYNAIKRK